MGDERNGTKGVAEATRPGGRLPYEKPAVSWEQPLDVQPSLMSGCAKLSAMDPACNATGPLAS